MTADPGYEAGERAAEFIGAKVIRVPLTKTYAHDVKEMAAASPNAGLIYVCNPEQPDRHPDAAQPTSNGCWRTSRRAAS